MAISKNIISKFVKSTKDTTDHKKKETFVQGKIEKLGDGYGVRIDGSDVVTPASITTNVNIEQPVNVMIKNHKATIIGNVSAESKAEEGSTVINSTAITSLNNIMVPVSYATINALWDDFE